jgi:RNA polymerase sigma factor (sigma-70 family)
MVMNTDLVTRAQRGDERAFATIVEDVGDRFLGVAHRILHDAQLAEDATQQAFVKLWKHLPSLRDPSRFDAWSYQLLVKACFSEAKRHRRAMHGDSGFVLAESMDTHARIRVPGGAGSGPSSAWRGRELNHA